MAFGRRDRPKFSGHLRNPWIIVFSICFSMILFTLMQKLIAKGSWQGGSIVAICQYGGEFVSNSHGSMTYTGGEAHAIEIGQGMLFDQFKSELTSMFNIDISGMSIKYFLPNKKRILITVSSNKDLQWMVDFSADASTAEVYILNEVDNRTTRSNIADSGTSIVATATAVCGGQLEQGYVVADSGTPNSATNAAADNANNVRQKRPPIAEDVDNGYMFVALRLILLKCRACPINLEFHCSNSASRTIVDDLGMPVIATVTLDSRGQPLLMKLMRGQ
ncbi:hypothetical protein COCNU_06G009770 [Cocos nucifera]|uniref:PB1 domain-containing protein n=1 Tax=Cocos nucifera TaxID=13894 RepID=A0A8K0IB90_COCNU|nr:hypothetical protein COCNU_06G009770 [Cocos nucifera]